MVIVYARLNVYLLMIYWYSIYLVSFILFIYYYCCCNFNGKWNFHREHHGTVQIVVSQEVFKKA